MKIKSILIFTLLIILSLSQVICFADGVTEFSENFDSFTLTEIYDDPAKPTGSKIINAHPKDGNYEGKLGDIVVYPNGEESAYEGNMANNLFVYDYQKNKIYGGMEGWTGHYEGSSGEYNPHNRRLTVRTLSKITNPALFFEPSKTTTSGVSSFAKDDIDFSGLSVLEFDVASTGTTTTSKACDDYAIFSLNLTKNVVTSAVEYEKIITPVEFITKSDATSAKGRIKIFGEEKADFNFTSVYSSVKWYHIKYVVDNSDDEAYHYVTVSLGDDIVAQSKPTKIEGFFDDTSSYGIMYSANAVAEKIAPRWSLDNISFKKATAMKVVNEETVISTKYPLVAPEINVEFDMDLSNDVTGVVTVFDNKGEKVEALATPNGKTLTIKPVSLLPLSTYRIEIKNLPYSNGMYFNKSLSIKTQGTMIVTDGEKSADSVTVNLKNNLPTINNAIVIMTVTKDNMNVSGGIYYEKISVEASGPKTVVFENIELKDNISLSDAKVNIFIIDDITYIRAVSDGYEL